MAGQDDSALAWRQTARRELCRTPVFTVTERSSTGPDGQQGTYIVNEARDWVIVIPVRGDKFLMVKQWRHGEQALSIEFPGGVIEEGEAPEAGALRELKEETGAESAELTFLGRMNPNPALFSNHVYVYCAEKLSTGGAQHLDSDEFVRCMEMSQQEVFRRMGSEEFPHALMAAALALYREKMR